MNNNPDGEPNGKETLEEFKHPFSEKTRKEHKIFKSQNSTTNDNGNGNQEDGKLSDEDIETDETDLDVEGQSHVIDQEETYPGLSEKDIDQEDNSEIIEREDENHE